MNHIESSYVHKSHQEKWMEFICYGGKQNASLLSSTLCKQDSMRVRCGAIQTIDFSTEEKCASTSTIRLAYMRFQCKRVYVYIVLWLRAIESAFFCQLNGSAFLLCCGQSRKNLPLNDAKCMQVVFIGWTTIHINLVSVYVLFDVNVTDTCCFMHFMQKVNRKFDDPVWFDCKKGSIRCCH